MHWLFFTDHWLRYTLFFFWGDGVVREGVFSREFLTQTINVCLRTWWEEAGASCLEQALTAMPWFSIHASTQVLPCWQHDHYPVVPVLWPEAGLIHVVWSEKWVWFAALLPLWWSSVGLLDGHTSASPLHCITHSFSCFLTSRFPPKTPCKQAIHHSYFFASGPSFATWHSQT